MRKLAVGVLCLWSVGATCIEQPCLNQLQVLATHNSYHLATPAPIARLLLGSKFVPPSAYLPQSWEYTHQPLQAQLDMGVRGLELDVHADPDGGLYSHPAGLKLAGLNATLTDPDWYVPGYKVFHVPDFDYLSTCITLVACLTAIERWSTANPRHLPITIFLEAEFAEGEGASVLGLEGTAFIEDLATSTFPGPKTLTSTPAVSEALFADLEREIRSVFRASSIVTPDFVRSHAPPGTANVAQHLLKQPAGTACPWPDLHALRGKVMFALILHTEEAAQLYRQLHPDQQGALAWLVWDTLFYPEAVFYTGANNDISSVGGVLPPAIPGNASAIVAQFVGDVNAKAQAGYLVRARTDQDTVEARQNYTARAAGLVASAGQLVTTDYVQPSRLFPSDYSVSIPGHKPARCINGAAGYYALDVACPL